MSRCYTEIMQVDKDTLEGLLPKEYIDLRRGIYYATVVHREQTFNGFILTLRSHHKGVVFYFEVFAPLNEFCDAAINCDWSVEVIRKRVDGKLTPHYHSLKRA